MKIELEASEAKEWWLLVAEAVVENARQAVPQAIDTSSSKKEPELVRLCFERRPPMSTSEVIVVRYADSKDSLFVQMDPDIYAAFTQAMNRAFLMFGRFIVHSISLEIKTDE